MIPEPLVSVVMPVFNGERYLRSSIESILCQTWRDFEFIIVNDGSTDETARILSSYSDPRLVILENKANQGLVQSLNFALEHARGEYVARHDADDLASPHRLREQVRFLETRHEVTLIGSAYDEIDADGDFLRRVLFATDEFEVRWQSFFQNPFVHSAVMFRRAPIVQVGGYSPSPEAEHVEDYDLWRSLLWAGHRMANLPKSLLQWRVNPQGVSFTHPGIQQVNYRNVVGRYLQLLTPNSSLEQWHVDALCALQTGSGFSSTDRARAAVDLLPAIVDGFSRHYGLTLYEQQRLKRLARRRAARTLLHNARQQLYNLQLKEAADFAECGLRRYPSTLLKPEYWLIRFKLFLGARGIAQVRGTRKRAKTPTHSKQGYDVEH